MFNQIALFRMNIFGAQIELKGTMMLFPILCVQNRIYLISSQLIQSPKYLYQLYINLSFAALLIYFEIAWIDAVFILHKNIDF